MRVREDLACQKFGKMLFSPLIIDIRGKIQAKNKGSIEKIISL
jgi:hypothetical protein